MPLAGELLIGNDERKVESRGRQFVMGDAVGNYIDCKALGVANRVVTSLPVGHDSWKFQGFGDPAPIFLPVQFIVSFTF